MEKAKSISLSPLTEIERQFAENNHDVVYRFLSMNRYSVDEYYGVVIMDYLQAVQKFIRRKDIDGKYKFSTVAFYSMRRAVFNYNRSMNSCCRKNPMEVISLDALVINDENGSTCFAEITSSYYDDVLEDIIEIETMENIFSRFTHLQLEIASMLMDGFRQNELCRCLGINRKIYKSELEKIKYKLMERI